MKLMEDKPGQVKFLVTTQSDHYGKPKDYVQESAVRSFLTSRQHAQRRSQPTIQFVPSASRPVKSRSKSSPKSKKTRTPIQHPPRRLSEGTEPLGLESEAQEDLSLDDLLDCFGRPSGDTPVEQQLLQDGRIRDRGHADYLKDAMSVLDQITVQAARPSKTPTLSTSNPQPPVSGRTYFESISSEINSVLDPFIRLPMELTKEEESLIHFYLGHGRCWLLGTSARPDRCIALDVANSLLQNCQIYVLAHIIIAELFLSKITGRPLRPHYYSRCAQMYNAMRTLLSDNRTTFHRKLWALIQLSMVEHTARRPDLQATHAQAMDDFLESQGGVAALLSQEAPDDPVQLNCRLYAGQFVRAEVKGPTPKQFEPAKTSFLQALGRLRAWASRLRFQTHTTTLLEISASVNSQRSLNPLINYLHKLIQKWLSADDPLTSWQQHSGAFFCPLSLAMTIVECDLAPKQALDYLHRVQTCMEGSTIPVNQLGDELDNLHPAAAAYIFGHVRSEMFANGADAREVRIAMVLVNAHKICSILTNTRRIQLAAELVEYVLSLGKSDAEAIKKAGALFSQEQLYHLEHEMDEAWSTTRGPEKMKKGS